MARSTTQTPCLLVWSLVAALISQTLLLPVSSSSFHDQKNFFYFPPVIPGTPPIDPGTPPIDPGSPPVTLTPPVVPSPPIVPSPPTGGYTYPPPTHGSGSPPPVHHSPPHHGGDHHHGGSPPSNCGNPTPPKHVDPSPPYHHNPSPSPPHHHNPSPSPPTGGYHYNPPSSGGTPPTPTVPSYSPPVVLPPTTPSSPPFDPNTPPIGGTCDFWRNHPGIIWGLFGWWGTTMGSAFGTPTLPGTGSQLNLLQALSNTRTDGFGALYREGTASLLNSMVNKNFPYSTSHVKDSFVAAVGSNKAAAAQARVFKLANEGHMKLRV
ncbi:putative protodermal factor 1 [Helianthus debilis subsp. tardiflorus]